MSLSLPTPQSFPAFPYDPPYQIQIDLMKHLYASIEARKITIVESPTGTGKTLSLLCSALTWLSDHNHRAQRGMLDGIGSSDAPPWVAEQLRQRMVRELEDKANELQRRLADARKREEVRKRLLRAKITKRSRTTPVHSQPHEDESVYLPDDVTEDNNISPSVRALMSKMDNSRTKEEHVSASNAEPEPSCTKIYYASRTHSQLAQVIPEMKRLKLQAFDAQPSDACCEPSAPLPQKRQADGYDTTTVYTRTVSLGSRKHLCINTDLRKQRKDLDEACRELLDAHGLQRCSYLPTSGASSQMADFRDQILASPKDIEDLAEAGHLAQICPYFGSRNAIPQAELVTLPYNLLLSRSAREALGIDLTGQIVIIDEAHNLISTLLSLSTVHLTLSTLSTALYQVCQYVARFRTRLSAFHLLHLKRLVTLLDALKTFLMEWKSQAKPTPFTESMKAAELLQRAGKQVLGINFLEIQGYLHQSKIARKIAKYSDKQSAECSVISPLIAVEALMIALSHSNEDGRILITQSSEATSNDIELKYQQLNPEPQFADIVEQCHAIVIAGGTMSPMSDFVNQLFPKISAERITMFSCGHIIPQSHLQTLIVCKGPSGLKLHIKSDQQNNMKLVNELGQSILQFAAIIPHGMIIFFPSYQFLNFCRTTWESQKILGQLGQLKKIFFEPNTANAVQLVLQEYSTAVQTNGAALFAVIGGKLSEGLNFADNLARAVIVIGLPFPNFGSTELRERLQYVQQQASSKDAGAELYVNMCMNSVNQSIGRAIRHQNDWAALILLDQRYQSSSIKHKLPNWIEKSCFTSLSFDSAITRLNHFYKSF